MRPQSARFLRTLLLFAFFSLLLPFSGIAQTPPAPSRITQAVDEANLTVLKGNTYYLARAEYDRGAAPATLPMNRMLLVLQRSPGQESALEQLLDQQQDHSSPNYHQWLTPQQFGQQYGPSDQDVQKITSWLQSHGFQVAPVSNGHTVIEFCGTAGQVQETFHTAIHKYSVPTKSGTLEDHWANSTDPSIPAALAPVVAGINTLHNFPRKPMHVVRGAYTKNTDTGIVKTLGSANPAMPSWTTSCDQGQETCFFLGPYDFAAIYNVTGLWNGSPAIDGTGQTIAVIGESDVDFKDIEGFQNMFGLPSKDPVLVLDGPDPGVEPGDETESDLDLEWSGSVAKGATIDFVIAATTNTTLGVDLAAQHAVDHNVAPIISESYGICELGVGTTGNQFYNSMWQQAAAQGITVLIAAGDSGSAGCDSQDNQSPAPAEFGLQVSGFASTPYDVAVGGTDFNDLASPSTYWNATNAPTTQASAKGYIPEFPWDDSCTSVAIVFFGFSTNPLTNCNNSQLLSFAVITVGGSGGKSACTVNDGNDPSSCSGGYAKPSWQAGKGVPSDGKRDIPDVALFASAGSISLSAYIICEADQTDGSHCSAQNPDFLTVGGTSASTPSFAGIMAMVVQKTASRQGNANYILYQLAGQSDASCTSSATPASTCIFYDITTGTNAMPCDDTVPAPVNCGPAGAEGIGVLTGYNATAGYDLTTGLGSVNAANLVNKWSTITSALKPSATTLSLNPTSSITHGSLVTVQINVTPTPPATGTATGNVALLSTTAATPPVVGGVTDFALTSGAVNSTTDVLPGGSYTVTAHYPGDGTFAASDSAPVPMTVTPEGSKVAVSFITQNSQGFPLPFSSGPYGSPVYLRADVSGNSGNGVPTGTVTFKDNGAAITGIAALTLNSQGNVLPTTPTFTFTAGTHPITGAYSGDPSFNASTSPAASFTITQVQTATSLAVSPTSPLGGPLNMIVNLTGTNCGNPPTGTVTFFSGSTQLGTPQIGQTATTPSDCSYNAQVIFTTSALPLGLNTVTAKYNGDTNYAANTSSPSTVDVQIPTAATIASSNLSVQHGTNVTFTAVVTPTKTGGPGPTGTVQFVSFQGQMGSPVPLTNGQAQISTSTLPGGVQQITATYSGDTDYASSSDSLLQTVLVFPTTTSVTTSNAAITQGASVTLTAQVTSTHSGAPGLTGTVQFSSAITAQGSDNPLGAAVTVTNGQAQLTTTSIPAGTQLIFALYSGDPNYATSNASTAEVVTGAPDFNITFAPATVNVSAPGSSGSTVVTVNATNGFTASVNLTGCTNLPSESTCSFSPAMVAAGGTSTIMVSTTAPSSLVPLSRHIDFGGWRTTAGAIRILLLCAALLGLAIQARRRWNLASVMLTFTLLIGIAACGGGSGGGGGGSTGPTNPGTPVVTNQVVTVTATSGTITHTFTFTLNVN
jgi:Pro-kumamolisin, activation domain/Bacterial Ig-like domain (group 3)